MLLGVLLPAQHSLPRRQQSRVVNKYWAVTQSQTLAGGDRPKPVQAAPTAAALITHSLCAATERPGLFSCIFLCKSESFATFNIWSDFSIHIYLWKWITIWFKPTFTHRNTSLLHALALHKWTKLLELLCEEHRGQLHQKHVSFAAVFQTEKLQKCLSVSAKEWCHCPHMSSAANERPQKEGSCI